MPDKEGVNRKVYFILAPAFNPGDSSGVNNSWAYHRAPEGYVFLLDSIQISGSRGSGAHQGIVALFDGHEYTHWNIFPGVESREMLFRFDSFDYGVDAYGDLKNWECKEYTIGTRSWSITANFKVTIIVWYYLKKAPREKLLEYALKHPIREDTFKRALRGTTVEPGEA